MDATASVKAVDKYSIRSGLLVIAAVAVAAVAFHEGLRELYHRWSTQEEYSHGFLIPFVTAWLLWTRREALLANTDEPSWTGAILIVLALAMAIIGNLSAVFLLSQVGFVVALLGVVLAIGGLPLLRIAFVPIAFLLFAIPLPYFVDALLTLRLQLISSELGVFFIRLFGIPVYLDGNIIDMGSYKLQVVEACSGLRYLYPLLSLSFLAAYLFHAPIWQRVVVFLSSIPIAIAMNGMRIGLVGILVSGWGNQMAEGMLHLFEGWVIFLACSILLVAEMYMLALLSGKPLFDVFYFPRLAPGLKPGLGLRSPHTSPLVACLLMLCVGGVAIYLVSNRSEAIQDRTRFVEFPTQMGDWRGHVALLDLETEKYLKVDDYILSDYVRPDGKLVNLYIAYYASQRNGESPHSPVVCLPGSGWIITDFKEIDRKYLSNDQRFNRVIIEKGQVKQLVYYWFDERGRTITNEWWAKFYLLADAIFENRTDGALVRLTTRVLPNETEQDADSRLQAFMRDAVPRLSRFLPSDTASEPRSVMFGPTGRQS
jgi:exosortase D (VPLPA-CTERM-specific)